MTTPSLQRWATRKLFLLWIFLGCAHSNPGVQLTMSPSKMFPPLVTQTLNPNASGSLTPDQRIPELYQTAMAQPWYSSYHGCPNKVPCHECQNSRLTPWVDTRYYYIQKYLCHGQGTKFTTISTMLIY